MNDGDWSKVIAAILIAFLVYGFIKATVTGSGSAQGTTNACYNYSGADC